MSFLRILSCSGILVELLLSLSCGRGSDGASPNLLPPTAAFTLLPASPIVGQSVAFTDSSSGAPNAWTWNFGDGESSILQNPSHIYATSGTSTITLTVRNATGSSTASRSITINPAPLGSFRGSILLGAPTSSSIKLSLFPADQSGSVQIKYGLLPGNYTYQTAPTPLVAGKPLLLSLEGLSANTRYYYCLDFQTSNGLGSGLTEEASFHTARPTGSSFTFTLQADSHLDENSDVELYRRTLANVKADAPDFHVDLGDTFMCEKHSEPLVAKVQMAPDQATVDARYLYERSHFGLIGPSTPLFLVNGNHEGEAGWLSNGSANNLAVWTTLARQGFFLNPSPDAFYTGDATEENFVGKRASWYAWHWGDALFVVLDPYWNSKRQASSDGWNLTLGERQYQWLQQTLSSSPARYKFVFVHNLVGGLDGQMRGGIEAAPFFEWGGRNGDGTMAFEQKRPGWGLPIHQLLVKYGVTAVFHGHDHLYARQMLDGILYQEVPQPSAKNSQNGPVLAEEYHYKSGTILSSSGHLRVSVSPSGVTSQYVRAWLPKDETAQRRNGQVDDSWSSSDAAKPSALFSFSPASPVIGQMVQFQDASSGSPTSWSWNFGDGVVSTLKDPSHAFGSIGTFTVGLTVSNAAGSSSLSRSLIVNPSASGQMNLVLGRPTATSITANLLAPAGTEACIEFGTRAGSYVDRSAVAKTPTDEPLEIEVRNLTVNTRYYYRLSYRLPGENEERKGAEHSFHTQRLPGSTFSFGLQGDSHPERLGNMFHPELYRRNLLNVAERLPDFYIALGDDFSIESLLEKNTLTQANVNQVYAAQREYLSLMAHSTPVFLVNGNHEQAAGYLLGDRYVTPYVNAPIFAGKARVSYFSLPATDGFYSADTRDLPGVGLLRDYYAWEWGDALFLLIDPYWHSPVPVDNGVPGVDKVKDPWECTMGDAQYAWFKRTLEGSRAKYKFVFEHHVLGSGRGGAKLAHSYEWGGYNAAGTIFEFSSRRPTWTKPIHQLMRDNGVTIFFFGHDHVYAREKVDGVIYQSVSNPADDTYTAFNRDAYDPETIAFPGAVYDPGYGVIHPNSGFLHVTVAPDKATVSYIRAVLPGDESKAGVGNGFVSHSYEVFP